MDRPHRYAVISSDCHAGADLRDYRPYLESALHEEFDRWADAYVNPFGDLERADATATGTTRCATGRSRPTASWPRSSTPTPSRRSSRWAVWWPWSPPPRSTGSDSPASARTTGGWPSGAPRCPDGGPASGRSCSTTSTKPSATSSGSPANGLTGGVLLPGMPPGCGIDPIHSPAVRPRVAGLRGARRGAQRARRQRVAVRRVLPRDARPCSHSRQRSTPTVRCGRSILSGVFDRFPRTEAGLRRGRVELGPHHPAKPWTPSRPSRRRATSGCSTSPTRSGCG